VNYLNTLILKKSGSVYKKRQKNVRLKKVVAKKIQLTVLLFLLAGYPFFLLSDLETFGYYENRFFVLSSGSP